MAGYPRLGNLHDWTILFRLGDLIYTTYGLLVGLAFLVGVTVALWHDAMVGADIGARAALYLTLMVPGVLVGARAFSVLLEWRELFRHPLTALLKPGYMLHGGVAGGAVALLGYAAYTGESAPLIADSAALALPVGEAIARLGCLVYGCCWGAPTKSVLGIRYTSEHAKVNRCAAHPHGERLHPAQLYASLLHLGLFVVLLAALQTKAFDGMIAALYLVAHPVLRVLLERFRSDDRGRLLGPLTHTNLYSGVQLVAGLALFAALAGGGAASPVDAGAHVGQVWSHLGAVLAIGVVSAAVAVVFGLHRGEVGAWIKPRPAHRPVTGLIEPVSVSLRPREAHGAREPAGLPGPG